MTVSGNKENKLWWTFCSVLR